MKCKSEVQLNGTDRTELQDGWQRVRVTRTPRPCIWQWGFWEKIILAEFAYLEAGFVNVDETSMVDMRLAYEFFQRVKGNTRILLVGDVDQLPSVGAGDVFCQLIQCGLIPVTMLDLVYRQGATSNIPVNAKLMQEGKTNLILGDDFVFVPCKGTEETADTVKRLYQEEVIQNGLDQVQILTPFRVRTAAGVVELNRTLEDIIRPTSQRKEGTCYWKRRISGWG